MILKLSDKIEVTLRIIYFVLFDVNEKKIEPISFHEIYNCFETKLQAPENHLPTLMN